MMAVETKQAKAPIVLVLYAGGQNDTLVKACACECAIDEACGCDGGYYNCGSNCDMCE